MRPNILFLMSDQHRYDVAGFAGNAVVRTPVLDRLAHSGTVFTNAYTPSPICIPGRQCLMSGQLPYTCGCTRYGHDLAPGSMTFAKRFSQYAYQTVCAGKLHHLGTDQMQGWTQRIAPDTEISDDFIEGKVPEEFARYQAPAGVGKWSNEREVKEARVADGPYQQFDAQVISATLSFIQRYFVDAEYHRPRSHRPLLLKVSLIQPHYPFFTDAQRFEYYHDRVPIYNEQPCDHPVLSLSQQNKPVHVSPAEIRRATAAYYGMVDQVDAHFGQVLDALTAVGQNLDDWVIVYTTDHGDMLGQHGIWEKTRYYEGSVKVPLVISWPARFGRGRTVTQNVSLCDLFATLCDCTGLPIPPGLDSRSLVPLVTNNTGTPVAWDNEAVSQLQNHVMIKQDDLKYQYYGAGIPEVLFDLTDDPGETHNVISHPRYAAAVARFRARLEHKGWKKG